MVHDEAARALPVGIEEWPILEVPGLPQQANGDDCGVYVLKYMEALASTDNISWEECSNWSSQTVKFRAELAAEMITTFAKKSSH
ncbi:hypothetical protein KSP39_PZI000659 [Platanthera zijinensis]|uniref:Ubiquitin-like protease family profile domain-containing protein n=1 Tax=Platanthera zijinensis TaxID=2320716 RepID=A0AAP0AZP9_9ASPA